MDAIDFKSGDYMRKTITNSTAPVVFCSNKRTRLQTRVGDYLWVRQPNRMFFLTRKMDYEDGENALNKCDGFSMRLDSPLRCEMIYSVRTIGGSCFRYFTVTVTGYGTSVFFRRPSIPTCLPHHRNSLIMM